MSISTFPASMSRTSSANDSAFDAGVSAICRGLGDGICPAFEKLSQTVFLALSLLAHFDVALREGVFLPLLQSHSGCHNAKPPRMPSLLEMSFMLVSGLKEMFLEFPPPR